VIYRIYFTVIVTEIILCVIRNAFDLAHDGVLFHIISIVAFLLLVSAVIYVYWFIWTIGR